MENGNGNGNGNGSRRDRKRDWALAFFGVMAAILAIVWWVRAGDIDQARAGIEAEQKKLKRVAALIEANRDMLRPKTEGTGSRSKNIPAITIIREIATACGIADRLIRVTPEENRKKGEVTAQVVLKGVRMQDVLRFLVELRSRYPQIFDREARLRLASRTEDRWDAGLALTYPYSS
jgi:hypothetical protein